MSTWSGRCHCGALGFEYRTAKPVDEWPVRACQCSFCLKHGGVYTSDPAGSLRFTHRDPAAVSRYRFGQKTADFLFCSRCGGYLGAVTEEDGKLLMVINLRALDPQPDGLPAPQPMSYEGETIGDRNTRRAARWTPSSD
ncbi:MAG: aldehyde-activating protein [Gammaproteobacteria bacterium]|nr:aldehyde-activating protein [Gammaproteobacteria bacterium]